MAKAKSKTAFINRLKKKTKAGWTKGKKAEAKERGKQPELPAGINNGKAQLIDYYNGTYDNGDDYLNLRATCVLPEEHDDVRTKGVSFFLKYIFATRFNEKGEETSTPDTVMETLVNDLKLLGADIDENDMDDLLDVIQELCDNKTAFKFKTDGGVFKTKDGPRKWTKAYVCGLTELGEAEDEYEDDEDVDEDEEDDSESVEEESDDESGDDVSEDDDEGEDWEPAVDDCYGLEIDGEVVEIAVTKVYHKNQKITCEDTEGNEHKGISWGDLLDL